MTVTEIIELLSNTSSTKQKEAILRQHSNNDLLKEVFRLAYAKELNFFVRNFKVDIKSPGLRSLKESLEMLVENIAKRIYTGDDARSYLTQLVQTCEEPETLLKVINRDLDCGIQTTLTNKVWKNLVTDPPYQSYTLFKEDLLRKFNYKNAFSDEKMDGLYVDIMVWSDQVIFRSRSGKELNFKVTEELEQKLKDNAELCGSFVAHGEALVIDDSYPNGVQPREIGNGYLNQDRENIDPNVVRIVVWDMVTMDEYNTKHSNTPYSDRRIDTENLVSDIDCQDNFQIIRGRRINSMKEAIQHFIEMRKQKKEGTVLKEAAMPWGDNKTKKGIKLKNEFSFEVEVYDVVPHKKNPALIGSLLCRSRDGLLEVGIGSGLTDDLRKKPKEFFIGQIITGKANDITQPESKDLASLFLPRLDYKFTEVRYDKTQADSLPEIIAQADALLDVLKAIAEEIE